jgi:enolase-phosphatase E1
MIKAILTDIEGTTSSLSFVKDVLFPYARAHLATYVQQHQHEEAVKDILEASQQVVGETLALEAAIAQFIEWIDEDKKVTPLKALQGLIWEAGYDQGDFKGHVYDDAVQNLQRWHAQGLSLYIYSSGSVYAQKLLFAHTEVGDLTPLFSGYFDTTVGGKRETASYERIAEQIGLPAEQLLFLSDIEQELEAAKAAGFKTVWLTRDTKPEAIANHLQVSDFNAITIN